jgi:hypothetical protein
MSKQNKSSDILARMRQATLRERPPSQQLEEGNNAPTPSSPLPAHTDRRRALLLPQSGKRVRFTLDLHLQQHKFLKRFALEAETDASAVVRALLARLEEDEALAESIMRQISA